MRGGVTYLTPGADKPPCGARTKRAARVGRRPGAGGRGACGAGQRAPLHRTCKRTTSVRKMTYRLTEGAAAGVDADSPRCDLKRRALDLPPLPPPIDELQRRGRVPIPKPVTRSCCPEVIPGSGLFVLDERARGASASKSGSTHWTWVRGPQRPNDGEGSSFSDNRKGVERSTRPERVAPQAGPSSSITAPHGGAAAARRALSPPASS